MSTVNIAECRRRLERHAALGAFTATISPDGVIEGSTARMEALIAYLPLLLDEVAALRAENARLRQVGKDA